MDRLKLFPDTVEIKNDNLTIGGCSLEDLARQFGTPLYHYDQTTLENSITQYREALARFYPGSSGLTYAGKAYLSTFIAGWMHSNGLWVDCSSEGEMEIAMAGGVTRDMLVLHGVNKSEDTLRMAPDQAGIIVVDNLVELDRISILLQGKTIPSIWIRLQPGISVDTHRHIQTGQPGSKFGMDPEQAMKAVKICQNQLLPLRGLHFHLGSQIKDAHPLKMAVGHLLDVAKEAGFNSEWFLSPGGGWGVAYNEQEIPSPSLEVYVKTIASAVVNGCSDRNLPLPRLQLEPGRSLVARAGVALYRVGVIKQSAGRTWIILDGGMADNPRPALYGTCYTALPVHKPGRMARSVVSLAGPCCESGDILVENISMPELAVGDLVAIPVSGAYQLSMASNYNGSLKPAVVWLHGGKSQLIQRRETVDDLLDRDLSLAKPGVTG